MEETPYGKMIKRQIGVIVIVALLASGCKKETEDETVFPTLDTLSVPTSFRQNVLFEVFTSTYGGRCPKYDLEVDKHLSIYPTRMFAVLIHTDDFLDADDNDILHHFFDARGVPSVTCAYAPCSITPARSQP